MKRSFVVVLLFVLANTLAGSAAVSSQAASGDLAGITTTGFGEASAPAESADMEIVLTDTSFFMGPPTLPEPEATPGAQARTTVAPVVDAVSAIEGVEEVEVVVPQTANPFGGPSPLARLQLTVTNPTVDQLLAIVTAAAQAAAGERLLVAHVGARFETTDCATLEREARQAALDHARRQAEAQADVLGVGLGEIVASVDVDPFTSQAINPYQPFAGSSSGCDPELPGLPIGDPSLAATLPPFDPTTDTGEVEVYRQVRVTFAINGGAATPAA